MSSKAKKVDLIIVGAGPVGVSLALALSTSSLNIAIIEAKPWQATSQWQGKSLALNYASQQFLSALGVWPDLASIAVPLQTVHISEQGHFGMLNFRASELKLPALGYLVPEPNLVEALEHHVKRQKNLVWFRPCQVTDWSYQDGVNHLHVRHDDQVSELHAPLLIAADGVQSAIRQACGIEVDSENYGQSALVSQVSVSHPQAYTAYQRFTEKGTIALLPLSGHRYGLIISGATKQIEIWESFLNEDFLQALQEVFGYRLGRFSDVAERSVYPLKKVIAKEQAKSGVLLLGNAAHAFHPVAAQGLNLSLQDVAALAEVIEQHGLSDVGQLCNDYESWRVQEQKNIMNMTDGIVSVFTHPSSLVKQARHMGLALLAYAPIAKITATKYACGLGGRVAKLMRGDSS